MFFVRPAVTRGEEHRNSCSKCASPHAPGQNFCTKCGWDLSSEYSADTADTVLASEMHQASSTATLERPPEPPPHDSFSPAPYAPEQETLATVEDDQPTTSGVGTPAFADDTEEELPAYAHEEFQPGDDSQPDPDEEQRPWGIPVPGPAPTAEGMTARGAILLSEGKLQEAIDQFTKAIALDPRHREAFEHRAEAYSQQGRRERADEDYRQVQALSTGT